MMKTEDRIQKQKMLVEELGTRFDKEGFPPVAGRVMALLMVMDKEQFTFDEIIEELSISKSSASNALRNLELRGHIEYVTLPGDRKRYFRIRTWEAFSMVDDFIEKMRNFQQIQAKILELKADRNSRNSKFFIQMSKVMDVVIEQIGEMKNKFDKYKTK